MDMMKLLLTLVLMMDMSFRFADAGDFALLVDIANATIYAGSMSQRLADAEALPLSGLVSPVAVDYDPVEKMVYWTDKGSQPTHKISRARLDGSNQMIVVEDLRTPLGMALDVESRMLYWSDFALEHIGRARMDGTGSKEIIVDNLDSPQTIVVDHRNGHIYWTDWGLSRIERANLDGSSRQIIIETDLGIPHGVAIYGK
ncbi:low-density lipoprotein receptor-related protein 4-like [Patiria miniata]|uniref:Uncharacterized protein n=1 Tax=Patiria miniata TaxID=46514 RepID=A0A914BFE3_PATMI|nr:low-density lipoprotein receptor-related protein 4-like [Patiria miniata]